MSPLADGSVSKHQPWQLGEGTFLVSLRFFEGLLAQNHPSGIRTSSATSVGQHIEARIDPKAIISLDPSLEKGASHCSERGGSLICAPQTSHTVQCTDVMGGSPCVQVGCGNASAPITNISGSLVYRKCVSTAQLLTLKNNAAVAKNPIEQQCYFLQETWWKMMVLSRKIGP